MSTRAAATMVPIFEGLAVMRCRGAGAGTAAAALTGPAAGWHFGDRSVMLTGAAISVAATLIAVLTAAVPSWALAVVTWVLIGFGPGWIIVTTGRVLRRSVAPVHRAALFSAQFSLSHACWLVTYPLTGGLVAGVGFGPAWAVLATLAAAGLVVALRTWPSRNGADLRHRHLVGVDHDHVATAARSGAGWIHAHPATVDADHPCGPVPA